MIFPAANMRTIGMTPIRQCSFASLTPPVLIDTEPSCPGASAAGEDVLTDPGSAMPTPVSIGTGRARVAIGAFTMINGCGHSSDEAISIGDHGLISWNVPHGNMLRARSKKRAPR